MVVDQEVDPRRDGGMKFMPSGDLSRKAKCPRQIIMNNKAKAFIQQVDQLWPNMMMMNTSVICLKQ